MYRQRRATTQLPFIVALFTAIKTVTQLQRLTCLVDGNGQLSETGWRNYCRFALALMLDRKSTEERVSSQASDRT